MYFNFQKQNSEKKKLKWASSDVKRKPKNIHLPEKPLFSYVKAEHSEGKMRKRKKCIWAGKGITWA